MIITCNAHFTPAFSCGSLTYFDEKIVNEEAKVLKGKMKRKMGFAASTPNKFFYEDKGMGGSGMPELENMNVFRRLQFFMKEWRNNSYMGEILFTSLTHIEKEMGIKVKRAIKKEINIDYVSEGWWKGIIKYCINNRVELDILDKTPIKDSTLFIFKKVIILYFIYFIK